MQLNMQNATSWDQTSHGHATDGQLGSKARVQTVNPNMRQRAHSAQPRPVAAAKPSSHLINRKRADKKIAEENMVPPRHACSRLLRRLSTR